MKTSVSLLLSCVFLVSGSAAEPGDGFGLLYLKEIPADGYKLSLDRVELHEGELSKGLFKFEWSGSEPVKIWGMGFDDDGTFNVLFENTSLFDGQQWTATNFGHCGTGSRLFEFQPGKEYAFRIAIWQFNNAEGEKGLVSIGGDTVSLVSEPFPIATLENAIASAHGLAADQPDNGFYLREAGEPARSIESHDGHKVFLGGKQPLVLEEAWLSSQENENSRFNLSVTIPYDAGVGPSTYILIVEGKAYRQTGSGASQEKTSSLQFHISGRENAEQVARYIEAPVLYRKHPRHMLSTSFIPAKDEFSVGDEVIATLRIKNVGANTVSFMKGGRNRAARDNQYVFSARESGKQVNDIGTSRHFGGLAARHILNPGELFEDEISLNKWFAFDKPGLYEVHGSYYLRFIDPDAESFRTIWQDYVSADFSVRIEDATGVSNKPDAADGL